MNPKTGSLIFLLLLLIAAFPLVAGQEIGNSEKTVINFFWAEGCPHCAAEKAFLTKLEEKYENIDVRRYNLSKNVELYLELAKKHEIEMIGSVPATFIGEEKYTIGFRPEKIEEQIRAELGIESENEFGVNVPWLGKIDMRTASIPLITVVFGLVDGFNPCAMVVLMFLLSILVRERSRKRIITIAGIFVLISGLFYFMFMALWINVLEIIKYDFMIRAIAGAIAIIVGLFNIKDFFALGKGFSFSISEEKKGNILRKIHGIVKKEAFLAMIAGVIVLAITVNMIELVCTFTLPVIYVSILKIQGIPLLEQYFYLILYVLFYMLDDIVMISIAVVTLSSDRVTEGTGKKLKLVSGLILLALGLALIFAPGLLILG